MFKRTIWWSTGAAMGFGSSLWVQRKVRRTVDHYTPEVVGRRVRSSARQLVPAVKAAVGEGRQVMRDREAELRAEADGRAARTTSPPP